jgi:glycosyltransferase involved in cell wall biosynthesis
VTFTPDDTSAATASVLELLENGTLRARVVEGGLEMVSATFTPERVVERYLDVVAQAVVPPATAGAGLG